MNPSHDARANMDGVPTMNDPYTNSVDPNDRTLQSNINVVNGVNTTNQVTVFFPPPNGQHLGSVQSPVCPHYTGNAMMANAVLNETFALFHQVAGAVQATCTSQTSELTSPVSEQPEVRQVALQMQENEHMHQTRLALFQAVCESLNRAADRSHESTERAADRSNVNHVHAANRAHDSNERTMDRNNENQQRSMDRTHESDERSMDRKQKEQDYDGFAVTDQVWEKATGKTKVRLQGTWLICFISIALYFAIVSQRTYEGGLWGFCCALWNFLFSQCHELSDPEVSESFYSFSGVYNYAKSSVSGAFGTAMCYASRPVLLLVIVLVASFFPPPLLQFVFAAALVFFGGVGASQLSDAVCSKFIYIMGGFLIIWVFYYVAEACYLLHKHGELMPAVKFTKGKKRASVSNYEMEFRDVEDVLARIYLVVCFVTSCLALYSAWLLFSDAA